MSQRNYKFVFQYCNRPKVAISVLLLLLVSATYSNAQISDESQQGSMQHQQWCSLAPSSPNDQQMRAMAEKIHNPIGIRPHRVRERDQQALNELRNILLVMDGGHAGLNDAIVTGHLWEKNVKDEPSDGVSVVYKSMGPDRLKIVSQLPSGDRTVVSNGDTAATKIGSKKSEAMGQIAREDIQILHLPQLGIISKIENERFGVSKVNTVENYDAIEILPPQRKDMLAEMIVPTEGTCIVSAPDTGLIKRIEYVVHASKTVSSTHRKSVVYEDYKQVQKVWVPFRQKVYYDGDLSEVLRIDNVTFNNGLSSSDFMPGGN